MQNEHLPPGTAKDTNTRATAATQSSTASSTHTSSPRTAAQPSASPAGTSESHRFDGAPESRESREQQNRESIGTLLRSLSRDVTTLVNKEIALAKAEMREAAHEAQAGLASMAGGVVIASSAVVILMLSAVYALSYVVEPWLAALIVGVVGVIIGMSMLKAAQKKMRPEAFVPERTIESVHKDKETAKGAVR